MPALSSPLYGQDLTDPVRTPGKRVRLPGKRKAAVIVRLLISDGADLPLTSLPETMQGTLTEEIAALTAVDRDTVRAVVEEFIARIDAIGLTFEGGLEGALKLLDGRISESAAARLRRRTGRRAGHGNPWGRLSGIEAGRLTDLVAVESIEVAAVILSKLSVSKAAEILGQLPGEQARRIAYTISQTGTVDPDTVDRIGDALAEALADEVPSAFEKGPVDRVGAILNFSPASKRDEVLKGLEATDREFAEQVRRAIFTFANIPDRIDQRDVPRIVRGVDQSVLVTAVAGARGADVAAVEFLLAGMSQRLAATIREEAEALGEVREKETDEAMMAIVASVRALEASGELFLVAKDD